MGKVPGQDGAYDKMFAVSRTPSSHCGSCHPAPVQRRRSGESSPRLSLKYFMSDTKFGTNIGSESVQEVLCEWGIGRVEEISIDPLGTINQTWLVTAESGRYAIRLSSHQDAARLQRECDLLDFVAGKGFPAVEPVGTSGDEPFVLHEEGLWVLLPFAPGSQTNREMMSPEQDRGMGRCLAQLFAALVDCPEHLGRNRSLEIDVDQTLSEMERMERLIRAVPNPTEYEGYALDRLGGRRRWIEKHANETTLGLTRLPHQVIHGDYQEKNVFFNDAGDVIALIDWDNAWIAPREWEIIRSLNFVMFFDPARGKTVVEGYLEEATLDLEVLDLAAQAYGVSRTHSLWLFEEIYEQGNERARRFLRPGPFVPVYERWEPLRDILAGL